VVGFVVAILLAETAIYGWLMTHAQGMIYVLSLNNVIDLCAYRLAVEHNPDSEVKGEQGIRALWSKIHLLTMILQHAL
jgi:hypothetical protein